MNDTTGHRREPRGRPRIWRAGALAMVLAGPALLAAACGGSPSNAAGTTAYQKALAYSQCMRAHGEPGFPDPQPNGGILINGRKDHLNGALMNSANKACQHLDPPHKLSPAQQRRVTAQALRFVACMRSHGLPNMPDPVVNADGISIQLPAGTGGPNSPTLQAAQRACRHLMPGMP